MKLGTALVAVLLLVVGSAVAEDKLILKDGQVVTGKILSETRNDVQIQTADETMRVPVWAIEKIEREGAAAVEKTGGEKTAAARTMPPRSKIATTAPRDVKPTKALLEWVDFCIERLGSSDRSVRASAGAALRSTGAAARPALEKVSNGDDPEAVRDAKRLLAHIKGAEQRIADQRKAQKSRNDLMVEALELDADQAKTFNTILQDHQLKQRTLSQSIRSGDIEAGQAADRLNTLNEERNEKLTEVLDEKQMQAYLQDWSGEKKDR